MYQEQKKYKEKCLSGGVISPREFGGKTTFYSQKSFLNQQTHGLPSGFSTEEKKAVKQKIAGGNMYGVLHNQYHQDFMQEAQEKDERYQYIKKLSKFDNKRFFSNRA